MQSETYAPGYSALVMSFMQQRTAESHAGFFLPQLRRGWRVLDAGCGPGTITLGLAGAVAPGQVVGIDIEDSQFGAAREEARRQRLDIEFHKASVYALPFPEASFDAVFSHALLEHLGDSRRRDCGDAPRVEARRLDWPAGRGYRRASHGCRTGRRGPGVRSKPGESPPRPPLGPPATASRIHRTAGDCLLRSDHRDSWQDGAGAGGAVSSRDLVLSAGLGP